MPLQDTPGFASASALGPVFIGLGAKNCCYICKGLFGAEVGGVGRKGNSHVTPMLDPKNSLNGGEHGFLRLCEVFPFLRV